MAVDEAAVMAELMPLAQAERDGTDDKALISIGPFSAFTLIGLLQLAYRHPGLSASQREIIRRIVADLAPLFGGVLAEAVEEGWRQ